MSRIGRLPITIPQGVTVDFSNKVFKVKGALGELEQKIDEKNIEIKIEGDQINVSRNAETKDAKSKHGLYRMLINNMVNGVVKEFTKTLIIKGVGYKATLNGSKLVMNIGYSHPVEFIAPEGITLSLTDANTVVVKGISKEKVGQAAAIIRSKKPVEPYHNYGIHYLGEKLVKKEGKTAGKK